MVPPTPTTNQLSNSNIQEKNLPVYSSLNFPTELHHTFFSFQTSPTDPSPYFLRYKVRPMAQPARRTSSADWSLTLATSSATLNKWAGWLTDSTTSGRWGRQTPSPRGACFLEQISAPASACPRTPSPSL